MSEFNIGDRVVYKKHHGLAKFDHFTPPHDDHPHELIGIISNIGTYSSPCTVTWIDGSVDPNVNSYCLKNIEKTLKAAEAVIAKYGDSKYFKETWTNANN